MKYSVIIPIYRGEKTIELLFEKIKCFFGKSGLTFQVVFVYDCGPDQSWLVIEKLKQQYEEVITAVRLSRNFGQHNAIICGFKYATGNFIITMDEDMQHDPEDIAALINKQKETKADVVYGIYEERKHDFFRNTTSYILRKLLSVGIPDLHKDYSSFRLIRAGIAKQTLKMNNSYTFLDGYLSWVTTNIASVFVRHSEGQAGKSSYTLKKLIEHSINIFVTFSNIPIRIVTISSFVILFISVVYAFYILFRKMFYDNFVTGFATFAIMGGIGIGIILFGIGVLGEYIHRMNLKTTRRPNYIEAEVYE